MNVKRNKWLQGGEFKKYAEESFLALPATRSLRGPPSMGFTSSSTSPSYNGKGRSPICSWSGEEAPAAPLISGVKGKLICPQAYPRRGLQTAHFATKPLPAPQLSPRSLTVWTPSASLPVMSPLNRHGGVAFPVSVSLTSPSLPHVPRSPIPQIISKGPRRSKLALLLKWTGMGDIFREYIYLIFLFDFIKRKLYPTPPLQFLSSHLFFSPCSSHSPEARPATSPGVFNMQRK